MRGRLFPILAGLACLVALGLAGAALSESRYVAQDPAAGAAPLVWVEPATGRPYRAELLRLEHGAIRLRREGVALELPAAQVRRLAFGTPEPAWFAPTPSPTPEPTPPAEPGFRTWLRQFAERPAAERRAEIGRMVEELVARPPPPLLRQKQLKSRIFWALQTFENPAERKQVFEEEVAPRVTLELLQELKRQTEDRRRSWREFLEEHRGGPGDRRGGPGGPGGPGGRDWTGGREGPGRGGFGPRRPTPRPSSPRPTE